MKPFDYQNLLVGAVGIELFGVLKQRQLLIPRLAQTE
jgi:hypothetical protein